LHLRLPTSCGRPGGRLTGIAAALLAATAFALAHATPSQALVGTYINLACDNAAAGVSDAYGGWQPFMNGVWPGVDTNNQCVGGGMHAQLDSSSAIPLGGTAGWRYTAPANTYISGTQFDWGGWTRGYNGQNRGLIIVSGNPTGWLVNSSGETVWPTKRHVTAWGMHDSAITANVSCDGPASYPSCPGGQSNGWMSVFSPRVYLNDDTPPNAGTVTGAAAANTTWKDNQTLDYSATDAGGGIAAFRLYVDGTQTVDHVIDTFNGHCSVISNENGIWIFGYPKPCPTGVSASESIDTTAVEDGEHTVTARVVDAAQREATLYSATKLIANHPPVNTRAPLWVAGTAVEPHPAQTLQADDGDWSGPNLVFAYQWLRCASDATGCVNIPSATSATYSVTDDDLGHKLRKRVTATNVADSVTIDGPLSGVVTASSSGEGGATPKPQPGTVTPPPPFAGTPPLGAGVAHILNGQVADAPAGQACPGDLATLKVSGLNKGQLRLGYGKTKKLAVKLTCTTNGKAITAATVDVATRIGPHPAKATLLKTNAKGEAVLAITRGASRAMTLAYRMFGDDPIARAQATAQVRVTARVGLKANHRSVHNGQAVTLRGQLAGGNVPKRGVVLSVQWRDGKKWRPFAQVRTDRKGDFHYAYRFTRTTRPVDYRLRVRIGNGQVDYPYIAAASKPVKVRVAP
jgi:hypothetical protein